MCQCLHYIHTVISVHLNQIIKDHATFSNRKNILFLSEEQKNTDFQSMLLIYLQVKISHIVLYTIFSVFKVKFFGLYFKSMDIYIYLLIKTIVVGLHMYW